MELILILIAIIVLLGFSQYLIFKRNRKLKNSLEHAEHKVEQYKDMIKNKENLSKQSKDLDKKTEEKKVERKKLSKTDKIALANSRS